MDRMKSTICKGVSFCIFTFVLVFGFLFSSLNADAKQIKFEKKDYSSFDDYEDEIKSNSGSLRTTLSNATFKLKLGNKKYTARAYYLSSESTIFYIKNKVLYVANMDNDYPVRIKKDGKFLICIRDTVSSEKAVIYKTKASALKEVYSAKATGTKKSLKKVIKKYDKKFKKKFKLGNFKELDYIFKSTYSEGEDSDANKKTQDDTIEKTSADFNTQTANFSIEMLKDVVKKEGTDKNVLISPDSIITALAMAENGAANNTLAEFTNVMSPGRSVTDFSKDLSSFNKRITSSEVLSLHVADSIWIKNTDTLKVKDDFIKTNKDYFNAEVYKEPFDNSTIDKVNSWVKTNTNEMIDKILDAISPDDMMYLINAVAFEGKWADQFTSAETDKNGKFTNADGSESTVEMMSKKENTYIEVNNAYGFVKYYRDSKYAFVGILPPEGTSTVDFVNSLKGEDLIKAITEKKTDKDVYIKLPKFKYDYDTSLKDTLQTLGIKEAFTDGADFSNMLEADSYKVKIDDVIHKTYIELDENGTKAAAVTAIIAKVTSAMPVERQMIQIYLDRPFVYAIADMETGLPIFIGTVNKL